MTIKYDRRRLNHSGNCEWCESDTFCPTGTTFDHCHKHGWVRGEVCHRHNNQMHDIDWGIRAERWQRWQIEMWLRCPDCALTIEGTFLAAFIDRPELKLLTLFMSRHQYLLL